MKYPPHQFLSFHAHLLAALVLFLCLIPPPAMALTSQDDFSRATILVSRYIKPYMEALGGLRRSLDEHADLQQSVFIMEQQDLEQPANLERKVSASDPDLFISIGPEATRLGWSMDIEALQVYTMVLNPESLANEHIEPGCGVSLYIPPSTQIRDIRQVLPGIKSIGILFDPEFNTPLFQEAKVIGRFIGLELVPLEVSSREEIPEALQSGWRKIDALWLVPDRTVSSQTLIEYIIKEALHHKKPVVGYNRFFYDSGAAAAFVLDFEKIGKQTADLAIDLMQSLPCKEILPAYEIILNDRVLKSLGITLPERNQ
ncbi:ABC transporter substrate binding protein [Desulfonatronospira sp.]|uniref:ABC transporter substrate-binding protein n=1 Tax=Desulfonatronospira sp. TaxID=1962951 RepID=UPI0025C16925|nr:ABC transporter substrate binding protein [Desulfonatronospira sp.]